MRYKEMTMKYELITPKKAEELLKTNTNNRKISQGAVFAYEQDILNGDWTERTGEAISIDYNGVLRDGQHRLTAIVNTGKSVHSWVCRGVDPDGVYDYNRKRSSADQMSIMRTDYEGVYKNPKYLSVATFLIWKKQGRRRTVTPKELIKFTDENKEILDGFFLNIPQTSIPKISITVVWIGLFSAYMSGVKLKDLLDFYDVLTSGMSTTPEEFPIIAYRNYLKDYSGRVTPTDAEIARCQYAIKKYLTGSCTKRTFAPNALIYPYPLQDSEV